MNRPAYYIDSSKPGSDLAGEQAAAFAASSMVFKYVFVAPSSPKGIIVLMSPTLLLKKVNSGIHYIHYTILFFYLLFYRS